MHLDEECLCDGGSFKTPLQVIELKKRIGQTIVNVLCMLEFIIMIIIIIKNTFMVVIILYCRI